jgi:hypothetical protein
MFTHLRTVAAAVVETVHAPPAIVFLQALQCQIPTAVLFTESYSNQKSQLFVLTKSSIVTFPQKVQVYRACCEISIFLTCLRSEAP